MDPDELAEALAARTAPPSDGGTNFDGRIAVNPQTGQRVIYRISPGGRGRFVALNYENADPQARERVDQLTQRVGIGERTLDLGRQFMRGNFQHRTGGIQNDQNLPEWLRPRGAQQLAALSNQMVGSNWQPGTSGMMNTATEQNMMRLRYPSPTNRGDVNDDVYLSMAEELAVQREAVADMQRWLSQRSNLTGWDEQFGQRESQIRQQARATALRELQQMQGEVRGRGAPAADIRIDAGGNVIQ